MTKLKLEISPYGEVRLALYFRGTVFCYYSPREMHDALADLNIALGAP